MANEVTYTMYKDGKVIFAHVSNKRLVETLFQARADHYVEGEGKFEVILRED